MTAEEKRYSEIYTVNNDANLDFVKKPTEWQESKNTFWDVEKKIENMFKTIEKSLNQTTLMFLRIWIFHPEIWGKVHELREKFDNNKQKMSREFSSGILWEIRELLNKYWDDKEKAITKDLGECLYDLQQIRSERHKARSFKDVVNVIDEKIWENMGDFIKNIDMANNNHTSSSSYEEKRNLSGGPFIYNNAA